MASSVPGQLLNAIKARKFSSTAKLFASGVDFQAWSPVGHWVAEDGPTVAKIIETWYSPGASSTIVYSNETSGARGACTLEVEVAWKAPPDDQPRVLRQVYLMTVKGDKVTYARVYCAGLHTEFPEVDLDKQRRAKGLGTGTKASNSARVAPVAAARAS